MKLTDMNAGVMVMVGDKTATVHVACATGNGNQKIWVPHFTLSFDNLADGRIGSLSDALVTIAGQIGPRVYDCLVIARAVSMAAVHRERERMAALVKDAYL